MQLREKDVDCRNWLVFGIGVLALAVLAMALSGCMSDGNGGRVIDWDQVDKLTERGLALYDRYQEQQAEEPDDHGADKLERAAFWASSGVVVTRYRENVASGLGVTESAIAAIDDANHLLTVIGIDKTYVELAASVFADEPDRPSDVDKALSILRASTPAPDNVDPVDPNDPGVWSRLVDRLFGDDAPMAASEQDSIPHP